MANTFTLRDGTTAYRACDLSLDRLYAIEDTADVLTTPEVKAIFAMAEELRRSRSAMVINPAMGLVAFAPDCPADPSRVVSA